MLMPPATMGIRSGFANREISDPKELVLKNPIGI